MELVFLGIVIFLFLLAVFDLTVGVSNDAVNFLSSAVGAKAGSFKTIIIVAAVGVFIGAAVSNGMMDIARHGIFRPENLSFIDIIGIFMAVMVTDVILLDIFNSLGMPTSTTVSLVFELLGATFVVALFKIASPETALGFGDLLNTEKALSVILGIFLSVAIAFVFGAIVQFLTRFIFTFEYRSRLKWKIGIFGGICCTAIIYFMLLKGLKDLSFMTPEVKGWINSNTLPILGCSILFFTFLSQVLHSLKVNVLKLVVLLGTFSLAMAFAGNDLVNFIGIPLTSLDAYNDFIANGNGNAGTFFMSSLRGPSNTPFYFLLGAGLIMVVSLSTSRKARKVTQTTVGLSSSRQENEMFGSSRIARSIVRNALNFSNFVESFIPQRIKKTIALRFDNSDRMPEEGASFDLVRGCVNLMLASLLIAWGTSMKLPLSTTFVTFMVAMGTSLADKAWGRDSAVFRITGVISVIGGWFVTAGVAFIGAGLVVGLMHLSGTPVMIAGGLLAVIVLLRNNFRKKKEKRNDENDTLFQTILSTNDTSEIWPLLLVYINDRQRIFLNFARDTYRLILDGFLNEKTGSLSQGEKELRKEKQLLKAERRKTMLCLRRAPIEAMMEKNTWLHVSNNMAMSMTYNLRRVAESCNEHVMNSFRPLPAIFHDSIRTKGEDILRILEESVNAVDRENPGNIDILRNRCEMMKRDLSAMAKEAYEYLGRCDSAEMTVIFVYINLLQESQEFVTSLRKMLRANGKLNLPLSCYRSFHTQILQA